MFIFLNLSRYIYIHIYIIDLPSIGLFIYLFIYQSCLYLSLYGYIYENML